MNKYKVGDTLYCYYNTKEMVSITVGKCYKINDIIVNRYLSIIDNNDNCNIFSFTKEGRENVKYLYKFFLPKQEYRKQKLDKISKNGKK